MRPGLLVEFMLARLAYADRHSGGTGRVAWLTWRDTDGQMLGTMLAYAGPDDPAGEWYPCPTPDDEPDHEPFTGYAAADVLYDETAALHGVLAKRQIVQEYAELTANPDRWVNPLLHAQWSLLGRVVALLAEQHRDHPDYGSWL